MGEIRKIKAATMFPLIEEIIEQGQSTRITVSGNSMYPFLRDTLDSVEFSKANYTSLSRGDIVLIRRVEGTYVMHRVIEKNEDCFFMVGDAQEWIEGPLYQNQLVAVVTAIWRKDKRISCSNYLWRFLSSLWLVLRPFRNFIFRAYRFLRRRI